MQPAEELRKVLSTSPTKGLLAELHHTISHGISFRILTDPARVQPVVGAGNQTVIDSTDHYIKYSETRLSVFLTSKHNL